MSEESLFDLALQTPPADRAALLDRLCAGNPDLRARVDALLAAHDRCEVSPPTADYRPADGLGTVLAGKYKLVEVIGEGGMGTVYVAQQLSPVKRTVAVKVIKAGMDSKAVLARFDAERQALAMMDHPNIARVLDAGTTDGEPKGVSPGRPFFVMELVKGTPITKFCDDRRLTPRQRLELFVPVCHAVQHAHQKGVIHRDLKPSNVLVALYDDHAVPKVIDFGVAKATGVTLTDQSLLTGFGAVVGTPEYMSPEQASFNNLDVDTRSDVYSLGVLLYELLTGTTPVDRKSLKEAALLEVLRIVREVEVPRPSAKLSTLETLPSVAACRGTEPARLAGLMRGELDWILLKALEKDRARRYETANAFARDIQRYLADEMVEARAPSTGYRLRKWLRKHRGLVASGGFMAASLTIGTSVATWEAIRADGEADRAESERVKTQRALETAERNREQAELNLVLSYLRPVGHTEPERLALDELARQEDHLRLLFLKVALEDVNVAIRMSGRNDRIIHAIVGLSPRRRQRALELLTAIQQNRAAHSFARLTAFLSAAQLSSPELPALRESFQLAKEHDPNWVDILTALAHLLGTEDRHIFIEGRYPAALSVENESELADVLSALIVFIADVPATELGEVADALVEVLRKMPDTKNVTDLCSNALGLVSPRLPPAQNERILEALLEALPRMHQFHGADCGPARAIVAIVPNLPQPARGRAKIAAAVDELISRPSPVDTMRTCDALARLIPLLEPVRSQRVFDYALDKFTRPQDPWFSDNAVAYILPELVRFAGPPDSVQGKLNRVTEVLIPLLTKKENEVYRGRAVNSIRILAPYFSRTDRARIVETLLALLPQLREQEELMAVPDALSECLRNDSPRSKSFRLDKAASNFVTLLDQSPDMGVRGGAAHGLVKLAPWLKQETVDRAASAMIEVVDQRRGGILMFPSGLNWREVAPFLSLDRSQHMFESLLNLARTSENYLVEPEAANGLAALAPRLGRAQQERAIEALFALMARTRYSTTVTAATVGLVELSLTFPDVHTMSLRLLKQLLNLHPDCYWDVPDNQAYFLSRQIDILSELVDLLRHPRCLGSLQRALLIRLEELAYPDPLPAATAAGLAATPYGPLAVAAVRHAEDEHRRQHRRFRTVSDAAKWLAEKHPEIPLD